MSEVPTDAVGFVTGESPAAGQLTGDRLGLIGGHSEGVMGQEGDDEGQLGVLEPGEDSLRDDPGEFGGCGRVGARRRAGSRVRIGQPGGDSQFGPQMGQQAADLEHFEGLGGVWVGPQQAEFLSYAFGADVDDPGGQLLDGVECIGIELEAEPDGEPDGSEHAEVIFLEPGGGLADGSDDLALEVIESTDVVEDLILEGVVEESVDGEIAALGVLSGRAELDGVGVSAVGVGFIAAEGGDFDVTGRFGSQDGDNAEGGPDGQSAAVTEDLSDLFGGSAGSDVIIVGAASEELIADAPAGQDGLVAGLGEPADQLDGKFSLRCRF